LIEEQAGFSVPCNGLEPARNTENVAGPELHGAEAYRRT